MVVPSRSEAADILRRLDPPGWLLSHSIAVADVAAFLCERSVGRGELLDRPTVEAAALLHDIDKAFHAEHPLKGMGHGHAGAQWLREQGYGELARAVAGHPVTRLADDREYAEWMTQATPEIRLVAYADKRATDRLLSLRARLDDMERRHPEHAAALRRARPRAELLERAVCDAAGVQPEQVARLPWAGEALGLPPDRQPDGAAA